MKKPDPIFPDHDDDEFRIRYQYERELAEYERWRAETAIAALKWIDMVNACDYEYVEVAREALKQLQDSEQ